MFTKKYGILVSVAAILAKLTKNVFVEVKFWPIFQMLNVLLVMHLMKI
jgi:hypothetical protein